MKTQNWYKNEFLPWVQELDAAAEQRAQLLKTIRKHSAGLQYVMSLIVEGRLHEALKVWNAMPLPKLASLSNEDGRLAILPVEGDAFHVTVDELQETLQEAIES